jgi:hypothetical protein
VSAEIKLKAFDTLLEWTRQIAILASATIVLSATFTKDLIIGAPVHGGRLFISWLLLGVSLGANIVVTGIVASELNATKDIATLDIFAPRIRFSFLAQICFFVVGMLLFVLFVFDNAAVHANASQTTQVMSLEELDAKIESRFAGLASQADIANLRNALSKDLQGLNRSIQDIGGPLAASARSVPEAKHQRSSAGPRGGRR